MLSELDKKAPKEFREAVIKEIGEKIQKLSEKKKKKMNVDKFSKENLEKKTIESLLRVLNKIKDKLGDDGGNKTTMKKEEKLKGGLADKMTIEDIAKKHDCDVDKLKKELKKGTKEEMEHTDDEDKAKEIAMDHLAEDPKFYSKSKKKKMDEQVDDIVGEAKYDCFDHAQEVGVHLLNMLQGKISELRKDTIDSENAEAAAQVLDELANFKDKVLFDELRKKIKETLNINKEIQDETVHVQSDALEDDQTANRVAQMSKAGVDVTIKNESVSLNESFIEKVMKKNYLGRISLRELNERIDTNLKKKVKLKENFEQGLPFIPEKSPYGDIDFNVVSLEEIGVDPKAVLSKVGKTEIKRGLEIELTKPYLRSKTLGVRDIALKIALYNLHRDEDHYKAYRQERIRNISEFIDTYVYPYFGIDVKYGVLNVKSMYEYAFNKLVLSDEDDKLKKVMTNDMYGQIFSSEIGRQAHEQVNKEFAEDFESIAHEGNVLVSYNEFTGKISIIPTKSVTVGNIDKSYAVHGGVVNPDVTKMLIVKREDLTALGIKRTTPKKSKLSFFKGLLVNAEKNN